MMARKLPLILSALLLVIGALSLNGLDCVNARPHKATDKIKWNQDALVQMKTLINLQRARLSGGGVGAPQISSNGLCVGCTLLLGLINERALQLNETPKQVFDDFCSNSHNFLGKLLCEVVKDLLDLLGLEKVDPKISPEVTCQQLKLCPKPLQCTLFYSWPPNSGIPVRESVKNTIPGVNAPSIPGPNNFWDDFGQVIKLLVSGGGLQKNIKQVFDSHVPMQGDDEDGDLHATDTTLRGTNWRGRDCDDQKADIYPGRNLTDYDPSVDHNCNGIKGVDLSGVPYEQKFCSLENQLGVAIIGDSATAHFSLPPTIFNATTTFNDSLWNNTLHLLLNEADWPQCSWSTGYDDPSNCPINYSPTGFDSIYLEMRNRNRCIHRAYINTGVNGARSTNVAPPDGDIMSFKRNQTADLPLLIFYALIGNDVCNSHPGFGSMTPPDVFAENVVAALKYLDTQLPKGSHLVFIPLADGLLLHDILHNRTHPIGVTYEVLYDYLICQGMAPCEGWMSSNSTYRELTQEWANNLSAIYPQIITNYTFEHFDMTVAPGNLLNVAVEKWILSGRDPAELIEPVDGFHPSQTANALTASDLWAWLEVNAPTFIGPLNPYNKDIEAIFGNQGGY